jgi:hypothetical protein
MALLPEVVVSLSQLVDDLLMTPWTHQPSNQVLIEIALLHLQLLAQSEGLM